MGATETSVEHACVYNYVRIYGLWGVCHIICTLCDAMQCLYNYMLQYCNSIVFLLLIILGFILACKPTFEITGYVLEVNHC